MKVILAVIVVIILAVVGFFAINPSGKAVKKNIFYYYPKANVYFDEATGEYLFLGADKTWQNNKKLTREQQDSLGKKIQIPNPKTPVWKDNDYHRLVYGTALYKTGDIQRKFYEDSLKSIAKKSMADKNKGKSDDDKDKKHRSGIKKFFDKIFK